jgi:hypothetical protein
MDLGQFIVSIISGGLAGGSVSTFANRRYYLRSLRTKFYPKVNDVLAAYVIRLEDPKKLFLIQEPDHLPTDDKELKFVDHRSNFIHGLVEFNELEEAREVRKKLVDSSFAGVVVVSPDETSEKGINLIQEYRAIKHCHDLLHKKLKLK